MLALTLRPGDRLVLWIDHVPTVLEFRKIGERKASVAIGAQPDIEVTRWEHVSPEMRSMIEGLYDLQPATIQGGEPT